MARKIAGERSLKIGKKTYTLRLGFEELSTIEDRYGSIITTIAEFTSGEPKISVLAFIFAQAARLDTTEAFRLCMENRSDVFASVIEVIMATLNPEGEKGSNSGE